MLLIEKNWLKPTLQQKADGIITHISVFRNLLPAVKLSNSFLVHQTAIFNSYASLYNSDFCL